MPDSPFKHDPTVGALLTLDDGTPVSYDGTWAEPLVETSWNGDWELVGSRGRATWSGGVDDALRGTVRFGAARRAGRARRPARAAGGRPAAASSPSSAARSPRATRRRRPSRTTSAAWRTILAIARSTEERRPVRVEEVLARVKIGLFLALYSDRPLEEALDAAVAAGCEAVEIVSTARRAGTAGRPSCSAMRRRARRFAALVEERGLAISALSCHGEPAAPRAGASRRRRTATTATRSGSRPSSASAP